MISVNRRGFLQALIGVTMAPLLPTLPIGYSRGAGDLIVPDAGSLLATIDGDELALELIHFRGDGLLELLSSTGSAMLQVYSTGNCYWDFGGVCPIARRKVPLILKAPAGSSIEVAYLDGLQRGWRKWTSA